MDRWEDADDGINHSEGRLARLGMGGFVKGAEVAGSGPGGVQVVSSRKEQRQQERDREQAIKIVPAPAVVDCPVWAAAPPHAASMGVSKSREEIDVLQLHKACTSFGRLPDNDVVADHGSLSRHHCHIAYDPARAAYMLTDLASAHGTRLNGARLEPHTPTQLTHSDEVVLGASSRVYQLRLPQEGERPHKRARVSFPTDDKLSQVLGYSDGGSFCRVGPQRAAAHEVGRFAALAPSRALPAPSQPRTAAPSAPTDSAHAAGVDDEDGSRVDDSHAAANVETGSQLGELRAAEDAPRAALSTGAFDTRKLKSGRGCSPPPRDEGALRTGCSGSASTDDGRAANPGDPRSGAAAQPARVTARQAQQGRATAGAGARAGAAGAVAPDAGPNYRAPAHDRGPKHRGAGAAHGTGRGLGRGEAGAGARTAEGVRAGPRAAGGAHADGAHPLHDPALAAVQREGALQQHMEAAPGVHSRRSSAAGQVGSADDTLLDTFFSEIGELE